MDKFFDKLLEENTKSFESVVATAAEKLGEKMEQEMKNLQRHYEDKEPEPEQTEPEKNQSEQIEPSEENIEKEED